MGVAEIRDLTDDKLTGEALIFMYRAVAHNLRVSEDDAEFCESRLFLEPSASTRVKFEDVQPNELSKFIKFVGENGGTGDVSARHATSMLISIGTHEAYAEILRLLTSKDEKIKIAALDEILSSSRSVLPDKNNPVLRLADCLDKQKLPSHADIRPPEGAPKARLR